MKARLYLDVHVLQTVPPSCVNRDDTGSPKTAIYGGTTRSRVSSQAWKHSMREMFRDEIFDPEKLGSRTKHVLGMVEKEIEKVMLEKAEIDGETTEQNASDLARDILSRITIKKNGKEEIVLKTDENSKSDVLVFISKAQANALAHLALDERMKIAKDDFKKKTGDSPEEEERKKKLKKSFEDFQDECKNAFATHNSIDIALFGRMVASDPSLNCDAAAQVAHSISTHTVQNEYDYFTAVDDLSPDDTAGAGHLGTVEFNSSTLYRYATVNLIELAGSLGKTDTPEVARGFVEAFVRSMPTGKQNTFANRTLPDTVYVTIRRDQPVNLCRAFEKPVDSKDNGYAAASGKRLEEYADGVYKNFAAKPECAFAVGDLLGELAETMPLSELLDRVFEKTSELLNESEGK